MKKHKYDIEDENRKTISAILRIAKKLNKTPTQKEYKTLRKSDDLSLEQIYYRFGKWSTAIKAAGLKPNLFQKPPHNKKIKKEDLIEEFIKVSNKLNQIPGTNLFRANSKFSWTPYKNTWGSWKNAVTFITKKYEKRFTFPITNKPELKTKKKRKLLNLPIPLKYKPINEYETIVLFAYLAEELGFKILKIQSGFPDAVLEKDGKKIDAEFEFLSSNFRQHCHPLDFPGICICWRKDDDLEGVNITSLEEIVRNKKHIEK